MEVIKHNPQPEAPITITPEEYDDILALGGLVARQPSAVPEDSIPADRAPSRPTDSSVSRYLCFALSSRWEMLSPTQLSFK